MDQKELAHAIEYGVRNALQEHWQTRAGIEALDHEKPLTGLEPASAVPVRLEIAARLYAGEILHGGLPWDCDAEDAHIDAALTMADRLIAAHNATLAKEGE